MKIRSFGAKTWIIAALAAGLTLGCGDDGDGGGGGGDDVAADVEPDAGADAGTVDAGTTDTGVDAGTPDTGADAGAADAGATDAGATDAGAADAGATDAGATDAGATDAGLTDTTADAGTSDAGPDDATDAGTDAGPSVDCAALAASITKEGLTAHLTALDGIATDNGGHRAAGSAGWDASVTYATTTLEAAGYTVTEVATSYPYEEENGPPVLKRVSPSAHDYAFAADDAAPVGDYQRMHLSVSGDLTGVAVTAVDLALGLDNTSSSGCEAEDFTGFPSGNIALLQRGTCYFVDKAVNAQAAGASGVIIFNQGDTEDRKGLFVDGVAFLPGDDFQADHGVTIPGVFATYAVGEELATMLTNGDTVTVDLKVDNLYEIRTSKSLVADTAEGDDTQVMVVGAHLDGVTTGPGVNDNGSGVAAVLELATAMAECSPTRQIRFALWGAEEYGAWGAKDYLLSLTEAELGNLHSYLNFDMIGSSNYTIFVEDGDGSEFEVPGADGSGVLEQFFVEDLAAAGYDSVPLFHINSDHFPFFLAGVPYAGVSTGASWLKTADEQALFGGTVDEQHDPCYHEACDNLANVDTDIATVIAKSYARLLQHFGIDGEDTVPTTP